MINIVEMEVTKLSSGKVEESRSVKYDDGSQYIVIYTQAVYDGQPRYTEEISGPGFKLYRTCNNKIRDDLMNLLADCRLGVEKQTQYAAINS